MARDEDDDYDEEEDETFTLQDDGNFSAESSEEDGNAVTKSKRKREGDLDSGDEATVQEKSKLHKPDAVVEDEIILTRSQRKAAAR